MAYIGNKIFNKDWVVSEDTDGENDFKTKNDEEEDCESTNELRVDFEVINDAEANLENINDDEAMVAQLYQRRKRKGIERILIWYCPVVQQML